MNNEKPIYAVPVQPGQISDDNAPEASIIIPVTHSIVIGGRPEVSRITDKMKKTYQYGYSLKIFSGIDIFFNFLYCLTDPFWFLPLLCSMSGYYGAKHFKKNFVLFYFSYEVINLISKFVLLYFIVDEQTYTAFSMILLWLSIIINVWILKITVKFIDLIRELNDQQIELLRNLGYKPAMVYH
tara:strand:- start:713 stop:1261 length:549 start_codon:yes stop_codon:yes gene_type:complete